MNKLDYLSIPTNLGYASWATSSNYPLWLRPVVNPRTNSLDHSSVFVVSSVRIPTPGKIPKCFNYRIKMVDTHFPESGTLNADSPKAKFPNGLLPEGQFPEWIIARRTISRMPQFLNFNKNPNSGIRAKAGPEQLPTILKN